MSSLDRVTLPGELLSYWRKRTSMKMCIDYKKLNKVIVKNKYLLPRIDDLLNQLRVLVVFSKIDLSSSYYQVRVAKQDIPKTNFMMSYDYFKFMVMSFGLTNTLVVIMDLMNRVIHDNLNKFIILFIDDILVYSKRCEEHELHLRFTLQKLREKQLYAEFSKYVFWLDRVILLRHVVLAKGISINLSKIEAILDWQRSKTIKEVCNFLGLIGYYRRFFEGFTNLARPLITLTKRETQFQWFNACKESFQKLNRKLTFVIVLALPKDKVEYDLYTDASHDGLGKMLIQ